MELITTREQLDQLIQCNAPVSYLRDLNCSGWFPTKSTFLPGPNGSHRMALAYIITDAQRDMAHYQYALARAEQMLASVMPMKNGKLRKADAELVRIAHQDIATMRRLIGELRAKHGVYAEFIFGA